ncbi:putative signal-transducing histidine kinase [Halosimplex carlsbadense 2-9-1]|uniref:histidine kinase n=1 Tax=Halosimplex carlsbadense 2-9-1 TaxID=797114 RepID=M0CMG5_9EURY|nr:histidine kinase N-terminal 7TM domain-containing protein [Halosimplex carlsbadense]ELZ23577.1 putative signal-transducing histidine kinase [Halosimplex carlsbadense 2-9-1]
MPTPSFTPFVLLAAIVGSGVAAFVWVFRDTPGAKPLSAFVAGASLFALAQGMALASPGLAGKLRWSSVAATVSVVLPAAWLLTVLAYTDSDRSVDRRTLALLLVEPLLFAALVWTNDAHNLVWADRWIETSAASAYLTEEFGLGMWAHVGYSYLLIAVGGLELVRLNFRTTDFFRSQGTALLAAMFVAASLWASSLFGLVPPRYDLGGFGFVFGGLVMTAALFRGRLLSITPATRQLGREAVVDEMDDRIVILDDADRVVDVNPAAARLLEVDPQAVVGTPIEAVAPGLASAIDAGSTGQADLELDGPDGRRYYDVRVSPLYRSYGGVAGRVVSFRDVTDRRQHEQRLDVLNRVLRHNLRNELNVVAGNAELLRQDVEETDDVRRRLDRIEETVDGVVARSEKIGHVSRMVDEECDRAFAATERVDSLADGVEAAHDDVTVTVDLPERLTVVGGPCLERAFEELFENAAEHAGEDPAVEVRATDCPGEFVEIRVADDGPGIADQERTVIEAGRETALEHGSGVGLWLVNWVVRECGGSVEFADDGDGCTVALRLPLADDAADAAPKPGTQAATGAADEDDRDRTGIEADD